MKHDDQTGGSELNFSGEDHLLKCGSRPFGS